MKGIELIFQLCVQISLSMVSTNEKPELLLPNKQLKNKKEQKCILYFNVYHTQIIEIEKGSNNILYLNYKTKQTNKKSTVDALRIKKIKLDFFRVCGGLKET